MVCVLMRSRGTNCTYTHLAIVRDFLFTLYIILITVLYVFANVISFSFMVFYSSILFLLILISRIFYYTLTSLFVYIFSRIIIMVF